MDEMRKKIILSSPDPEDRHSQYHLHVDVICEVFSKQVTIHITMEVSYRVRD